MPAKNNYLFALRQCVQTFSAVQCKYRTTMMFQDGGKLAKTPVFPQSLLYVHGMCVWVPFSLFIYKYWWRCKNNIPRQRPVGRNALGLFFEPPVITWRIKEVFPACGVHAVSFQKWFE